MFVREQRQIQKPVSAEGLGFAEEWRKKERRVGPEEQTEEYEYSDEAPTNQNQSAEQTENQCGRGL